MITLQQFLEESAGRGEAVNLMFEERLFGLVEVLHRIAQPLMAAGLDHEVIGGLAVLIHVEEVDPSLTALTRDVDVMVRRSDLEEVKAVAEQSGFRFRHARGLDMLLFGETETARNAVHLVFSGETVANTQIRPNPPIRPVIKTIHGGSLNVIPVADLVAMKLSAFRDKDRVHVRSMDEAGLISRDVEEMLPEELRRRLHHVRSTD